MVLRPRGRGRVGRRRHLFDESHWNLRWLLSLFVAAPDTPKSITTRILQPTAPAPITVIGQQASARIVVTGAAGFIGSHVVDGLLARGDEVVGIDSFDPFYDPRIKRSNLAAAAKNPAFRLIEEDVRNVDKLNAALGDGPFDVIIHLAAATGV